MEARIQSSGRLRRRYLPALYLDPSFFGCYVAAAIAVERPHSLLAEELPTLAGDLVGPFAELVGRLRPGTAGMTPVVSALTLLRWMQETAPLYIRADPGDGTFGSREESDFAGLRFQSWLNRLLGDALEGVMQVDLRGFVLTLDTVWEEAPAAALRDGPERCTLHALAARHLGCTHLATMRPEMVRIAELLRAGGGPQPLLGPRAVLAALAAPPRAGGGGEAAP
jgi:hypothetical protein